MSNSSSSSSSSYDLYLFPNICDDGSPFWNSSLSWETSYPTLTKCFIDTAIALPPTIFILLFAPYICYDYIKNKRPSIKWNYFNGLKCLLSIILLLISLIHSIIVTTDRLNQDQNEFPEEEPGNFITKGHVLSVWLITLTYSLFALFLHLQRKFGFINCGINWFYLTILIIFDTILLAFGPEHRQPKHMIFEYLEYSIELLLFIMCSFSDKIPNIDEIMFHAIRCGRTESMVEKILEDKNNKNNKKNFEDIDDIDEKDYNNNNNNNKKIMKKMMKKSKKNRLCPKEMASVPSKLTFWWFNNLSIKGWRRPLTENDLWDLPLWNQSGYLFKQFNKIWRHPSFMDDNNNNDNSNYNHNNGNNHNNYDEKIEYSGKYSNGNNNNSINGDHRHDNGDGIVFLMKNKMKKVNLWMMFLKMFWIYFFFPSFARLATDLLQLVNPMVLKLMIQFSTNPSSPMWQGVFYSFIFMFTNIFQSLCSAYQQHRMAVLALRIKSVLISAIYRKSLVLAMHAKKSYTTGEIVNLMAVDSQRFTELVPWICFLWSAPIQIGIGLYLLWNELGPSVIGGVIIMIATLPLNSFVANHVKKIQREQMKLKDSRLKSISELLNGMKVLKLYAWEKAFLKNINLIRFKELFFVKKSGLISTIFVCSGSCSPFIVSLVTFTIYIFVSGGTLDAEKAFVSISLFNLLRIPLIMIPNMISSLILTMVSMKRINKFLNQDEINDYIIRKPLNDDAIQIKNASFSWDGCNNDNDNNNKNENGDDYDAKKNPNQKSERKNLTLSNINVSIKKNKLIAVVGPVASGKSSFLYSILGEMIKHQGSVMIDSDQQMAYVPQQAWIQNLTLRNNILFGLPYDEDKYNKVIYACALKQDFEMLSGGDQTEIGEKGINLSGGQKQRVSIARACYSNSNLYLFDDPLSAVDSHVGKHIFEKVLSSDKGILKDKTRILVTNALYVLPDVDEVILIKDGKIEDVGTYQNLLDTNEHFQELIATYSQSNQEEAELELGDDVGQELVYEDDDDDGIKLEQIETLETIDVIDPEKKTTESMVDEHLMKQMKTLSRSISVEVQQQQQRGRTRTSSRSRHGTQLSSSTITTLSKKQKQQQEEKSVLTGKLVEVESMETGQISLAVYKKFIMAVSPMWSLLILFTYVGACASAAGANVWLSVWTGREENGEQTNTTRDMIIYFSIGFLQVIFVITGWMTIILGTMNASKKLHSKLVSSIVHAPMYFFDTTPLGRIINRFSKDIDILDNYIQPILRILLNCTFQVFATLVIISTNSPLILIFVIPFMILYYFFQRFYVSTSRQLKRIESVSRSPIFTHFSETIQGVSTIKAYGATERFILESNRRVDHNQRCFYPSQVANCWLQVRLEFLANCLVFFASFIATISKEGLTGSKIGLSLSYALNTTLSLNWCVRMFAEIENQVVSVERISEYTDVEPEAPWEKDFDDKIPKQWPQDGVIEFQKYSTRYRPGLDLVLKGIDLNIRKGEKIGIVGRTGAGKSSLTLALFRIIESSQGQIKIDDVNISELGLHKLRSRITIIPQDPVLFCGTLRFNLDPFDNYTDEQLWNVLELAHLKTFAQSLESGLQYPVSEGGENLSVGERQLVCLGRALLRRTNVLVLDEATAAVDIETDALIQATIRKEFTDCTVLTIAHRLNTIMDSDRVLVLDSGCVAEFGSPKSLLANNQSIFYSLAKDAGIV